MMKTVVTVVVTLLFSLLPLGHNVRAQEDSTEIVLFDYEILTSSPIPVPLSDFTAVLDPIKNQTYLAGGCNSPEGNRFNTTSGNFNCASLSDKMYVFNMDQRSFEEVAFSMPVARYRHAAAWTNNQVWLVGGRALNDDLITEVDVFDIATSTWKVYDTLPEDFVTSDLASFVDPATGNAFFAGGFNQTYAAQPTVFAIDVVATTANESGTLIYEEKAPMFAARGDCTGVSALTRLGVGYALVVGGFTHEDDFCAALATTEYYDFARDLWRKAADMETPRADKALVVLGNVIYAVGGEQQIANICSIKNPEPGEKTVLLQDVEYWNVETDTWVVVEDLPGHRFRLAAVGYNNEIYSFGGQVAFEEECQCFRTSDEVTIFSEEEVIDTSDAPSGTALTTNLMLLFGICGLVWCL